MDLRLTTIATFCTPEDAEVARLVLEENGIESFQEGATTVGLVGYLGNATGWVKLQVPETDVPRARELLAQHLDEGDAETPPLRCPNCGETVPADYEICWACESPMDESATPIPGELNAHGDEESELQTAAGDATAWRAFVAAIIGLLLCPPLLHFYSGWLLLCIAFEPAPLSKKGRQHFWIATAIDLVVFIVAAWYIRVITDFSHC